MAKEIIGSNKRKNVVDWENVCQLRDRINWHVPRICGGYNLGTVALIPY